MIDNSVEISATRAGRQWSKCGRQSNFQHVSDGTMGSMYTFCIIDLGEVWLGS